MPWRAEPTLGTGAIVISCSEASTVMITIGPGGSGDAMRRTMSAQNSSHLVYNLYVDPRYSQIWGDGLAGASPTFSVPGGYKTVRVPVYGAIVPRQSVASGAYGDDPYITIAF